MWRFARFAVSASVTALLLCPRTAAAHDEPVVRSDSTAAPTAAGEAHAEEGAKEEAEPPWEVIADVVGGATTTEVLTGGRPTRIESPPTNVFDSTRITAYSLLIGLERHLGERLTVGARIPFIQAELRSRTGAAENRSVFLAGNLELEGAFVIAHGKSWNLVGTLELALPTAGGKEPPTREEVLAEPEKRFDYKRYDTFAAAHAASAVRGAYESALFEPGNLGIVPKITANIHLAKLTITPTVKLENLFNVTSNAEEVYINELVAGVRASYRVFPAVEPGVHVWVTEAHEHTHHDDTYSTLAVFEPFASFHFGGITPTVGAILPFTGDLADAKTFGIRVKVAAEF